MIYGHFCVQFYTCSLLNYISVDYCALNTESSRPCSQLCLSNPVANGDVQCGCMQGFQLQTDGVACLGEGIIDAY